MWTSSEWKSWKISKCLLRHWKKIVVSCFHSRLWWYLFVFKGEYEVFKTVASKNRMLPASFNLIPYTKDTQEKVLSSILVGSLLHYPSSYRLNKSMVAVLLGCVLSDESWKCTQLMQSTLGIGLKKMSPNGWNKWFSQILYWRISYSSFNCLFVFRVNWILIPHHIIKNLHSPLLYFYWTILQNQGKQ